MVGRFGTSEGRALFAYYQIQMGHRRQLSEIHHINMCVNAGFFPDEDEMLYKWAEMLSAECEELDLLGVMKFKGEKWIAENLCPQAQLMPNGGIATGKNGWSDCLEGKKVLVIHPFTKSIEYQYKNHREELYPGTNKMPVFDLKLIKAVQTIADSKDERFVNWFEALDYMTEEAEKVDFDVALIGCGAYGFPLAARIKRMNKVAIHMGGAVQNLFGIKSARGMANSTINKDYNDAWIFPDESEIPEGYKKVENGCYWK